MWQLEQSVGRKGKNHPSDVVTVAGRLVMLGFTWVQKAKDTGVCDDTLIFTIKLFQSIVRGFDVVSTEVDGRVDPFGPTLAWLNAANAPAWRLMPVQGVGLRNDEAADRTDHHDWGTSWLASTALQAGCSYAQDFLRLHPDRAPIVLNDTSLATGGDTKDHAGHETGLAVDTKLPRLDGTAGGITWRDALYDREAMRAQLQAWWKQPGVEIIYFNDPELIAEGLCHRSAGHDNHAHVEIKPPTRAMWVA